MSAFDYRTTFLVRFFAYFLIIIASVGMTFEFGPLIISEFSYRKDQIFRISHKLPNPPQIITSQSTDDNNSQITLGSDPKDEDTSGQGFGKISSNTSIIKPLSTDYGLVIEKINANTKVIPDINPADEKEYTKALSRGVAEARGSTKPGQNGNLFIFSHSADAPWNIIRFNAVFYLLRELEKGDKVVVFYQGRRYDYIVFDKAIVGPKDTSFLTNRYDKPVLTLQTCDPPGTVARRLIVRAQLLGS